MSQSVLVVDDEPNIVISLEYVMKNAGYEVETAYDGEDALTKIKAGIPDLVILDVMMPKRDGFDVLKTVREDPNLNSVRIMMLTAKGRDEEREKGLSLGANDYMTKPFSTRDVVERAKVLLDKKVEKEAI